jgi:hypothetical protein
MEWFTSTGGFHPFLSVIAGVIILIWPTILNYVIAIWLILTGIMGYLG